MNFNGLHQHRRDPKIYNKKYRYGPMEKPKEYSRPITPIKAEVIREKMNIKYDDAFSESDSIYNV